MRTSLGTLLSPLPTLLSSPQRPGGMKVKIPLPPSQCITSRIPLYQESQKWEINKKS